MIPKFRVWDGVAMEHQIIGNIYENPELLVSLLRKENK